MVRVVVLEEANVVDLEIVQEVDSAVDLEAVVLAAIPQVEILVAVQVVALVETLEVDPEITLVVATEAIQDDNSLFFSLTFNFSQIVL